MIVIFSLHHICPHYVKDTPCLVNFEHLKILGEVSFTCAKINEKVYCKEYTFKEKMKRAIHASTNKKSI